MQEVVGCLSDRVAGRTRCGKATGNSIMDITGLGGGRIAWIAGRECDWRVGMEGILLGGHVLDHRANA